MRKPDGLALSIASTKLNTWLHAAGLMRRLWAFEDNDILAGPRHDGIVVPLVLRAGQRESIPGLGCEVHSAGAAACHGGGPSPSPK